MARFASLNLEDIYSSWWMIKHILNSVESDIEIIQSCFVDIQLGQGLVEYRKARLNNFRYPIPPRPISV